MSSSRRSFGGARAERVEVLTLAGFLHLVERRRHLRVNPRRKVRLDPEPPPFAARRAEVTGDDLRGHRAGIGDHERVAKETQIVR